MRKRNTQTALMCISANLVLGCSSSATGTTSRHDAYALATCSDTVSCCIQRNPGVPEACGLTASEAALYMAGVKTAMDEATKEEEAPVIWDDAHNGDLPEWRRECIRFYGDCKTEPGWTGPCYECLRRCEAQEEWPVSMCKPGRKTRRK
ncbi:hypothetical protein [Myxococcus sp. NMCA1]|uniref:hypothetical protein n=1 Tax=Myxococcus sp. NMCA1 TaxID=2996785 RepID=UPI0022869DC0|nr:hypothetical protein [Myxococcus sp. NMCA1]WAM26441.1 hypothetical protein OZ403_38965 [Myxococcus sp. NMCA1]